MTERKFDLLKKIKDALKKRKARIRRRKRLAKSGSVAVARD